MEGCLRVVYVRGRLSIAHVARIIAGQRHKLKYDPIRIGAIMIVPRVRMLDILWVCML